MFYLLIRDKSFLELKDFMAPFKYTFFLKEVWCDHKIQANTQKGSKQKLEKESKLYVFSKQLNDVYYFYICPNNFYFGL